MGLQDLTAKGHQIEYAYKLSGRAAGSQALGTIDRTFLLGFRRCLQDITGSKLQIERAYEVSEWCCMLTRYHDRASRSHGFGTPDRTRLSGIRTGLQDLTG